VSSMGNEQRLPMIGDSGESEYVVDPMRQRCGTCRWWKIHDGQENRIDCATGVCAYPLPICLPDEYRITPYAKAGKDCPTWTRK